MNNSLNKLIEECGERIEFYINIGQKNNYWIDLEMDKYNSIENEDMMYPFTIDFSSEYINEICTITGYIVNNNIPFWTLDAVSGDFTEIAAYALEEDGGLNAKYGFKSKDEFLFEADSFIIIDRFKISENLRNKGLGSLLLKPAIKAIISEIYEPYAEVPYGIVLLASAYEYIGKDNLYKEQTEKLIKFYERLGFKRIKETKVMYLTEKGLNSKNKKKK